MCSVTIVLGQCARSRAETGIWCILFFFLSCIVGVLSRKNYLGVKKQARSGGYEQGCDSHPQLGALGHKPQPRLVSHIES